jgi:tetratricopeptide (TPR) repeat protein
VAELPAGYKDIPEEDQKRAQVFFDRARTVAETGNYEYAIEMHLQGLNYDPESVETHKTIRELSMIRKARGGKPLGFMERSRIKKGDEKQNMLNAEKLLAYDPGNMDYMQQFMLAAQKAGCYDTVLWIGNLLLRANVESKQPSFQRYITIKDAFKAISRYKEAVDAMNYAVRLKPSDMDLSHEMKNLAAEMTIGQGNYTGESFRGSIRDMDAQKKLLEQDMDIRSEDSLARGVREQEQQYKEDPTDPGRFNRYIDALRKTEHLTYENQAIELLEQRFRETKQYRFKANINQIALAQMSRQERTLREGMAKAPTDAELRKEYASFIREKYEQELRIFKETVENYPTDTTARYEMSRRLFLLKRWDEAIPVLQQVRMDPKYKVQSSTLLGRAFLEAGFVEEAVDTLQEAIQAYPVRGDEKSIEIHYYYAVALEQKGDIPASLKMYSQVAQWNFNYRDVQQRIKRLRGGGTPPAAAAT